MRVSVTSLAILVCAIVLISGVSAQGTENGNAGYSVSPAGSLHMPAVMLPTTVGTISQGETDWYTFSFPSGKSSLTVDLNWGYVPDSLALTVIAPDGTLGPYYDADDGVTDGRISITISRTGGIAPGTWRFKVYGMTVLGTQSYNFVAY
jgi:Bacterial pre-peptidase C-terminal domain.